MSDCIFCDILAGEAPASIVCEDEQSCASLDIQPVDPGHVLVIPISHAATLAKLDEEVGARMFRVARRVGQASRGSELKCEGVNLHLADGIAAGQESFHVLPRYEGDGFGSRFGAGYGARPAREELDAIAGRIRSRS
jgi:histidine triad (HIT) family protein